MPEQPLFVALTSSWRQPISKTLSFPVKAMQLDQALAGVPQAGRIAATFSSGYRLAHKWAETGRYPLLEGHYGFGSFDADPKWSVTVLPVPRTLRHEASTLLVGHGLSALRAWFVSAAISEGMEGGTNIVVSFEPGTPVLLFEYPTNLFPPVGGHA